MKLIYLSISFMSKIEYLEHLTNKNYYSDIRMVNTIRMRKSSVVLETRINIHVFFLPTLFEICFF